MVRLFLPVLLLLLANPAAPISVEVMPRIAFAPTTVRITVRVEPNEYNRGMALIIDSGSYYRASFDPDYIGMEGPKIRNYLYELRSPGNYIITAIIKRAFPEKDKQASTELCLAGPNIECGN